MQEEAIKRIWKSLMRKKKRSCEKKETAWSFLLSFLEDILYYQFTSPAAFFLQIQSPELKKNDISTLKSFIVEVKRG